MDPGEREALVIFYKATGGDAWTRKDGWCTNEPLQKWYGVETDENGSVVGLNLGKNNLVGEATPFSLGGALLYLNDTFRRPANMMHDVD